MTEYRIEYVPDELTDGRDFVLCSGPSSVTIYLRQGIRSLPNEENADALMRAWAAFNELPPPGAVPSQREPAYTH